MRTVSRVLAAAATAVLVPCLAAALPAASAANAAAGTTPTAHTGIAPVAGGARYLAYVRGTTTHKSYVPGDETTGTLHVLTATGKRLDLGPIMPRPGFSLVDATLIETSFSGPTENLKWWDLAKGTHGSATGAASEWAVGAAPDGWLLTTKVGGGHVIYQHFGGKRTDLGRPLPAGVGYSAVTGASGFVAYGDNDENGNGEIVFAPWAHPTKHTVLQKPKGQENSCSAVDVHWAACGLSDLTHSPLALIRVSDGKQVRTTNRCRFEFPALFGNHAAWVNPGSKGCPRGTVEMLDSHGHLTVSTRHGYNWYFRVGALGRFVTTNKAQTELLGLRTANGTPKVLARA
ncbi:MAG TPA: hypothetical protein VME70_07570 [Mycobacteriales bacterium]|nr:hypothetical protein [Mycobacteriales bacterium]